MGTWWSWRSFCIKTLKLLKQLFVKVFKEVIKLHLEPLKLRSFFSSLIIQIMHAGLNRKFIRIAAKNYIQQSTLFSNYSSQIKFLYSSIILAIKFKLCKGTYIKMCVHCLVYNQLTYLNDFYICLAAVSHRHRWQNES